MGVNQSIDRSIPEELDSEQRLKSLPKVSHQHQPRLHNFREDYYQSEFEDKNTSRRRISIVPSQQVNSRQRSPNVSANASTYDIYDQDRQREDPFTKKHTKNTLEVQSPLRTTPSFSDCDLLSNYSGTNSMIKKMAFDKRTSSLVKRSHFWEALPLQASYKILEYCMNDLPTLLKVHSTWKQRVKAILYFKSSTIVNKFKNTYHKQLPFVDHKVVMKKMRINLTGKSSIDAYRLDLLLTCKVDKELADKAVTLSYQYRLESKQHPLFATFSFDSIKSDAQKLLWLFTEQRKVIEFH